MSRVTRMCITGNDERYVHRDSGLQFFCFFILYIPYWLGHEYRQAMQNVQNYMQQLHNQDYSGMWEQFWKERELREAQEKAQAEALKRAIENGTYTDGYYGGGGYNYDAGSSYPESSSSYYQNDGGGSSYQSPSSSGSRRCKKIHAQDNAHCGGSGVCSKCNGNGKYFDTSYGNSRWVSCTYCGGSGRCGSCGGTGRRF